MIRFEVAGEIVPWSRSGRNKETGATFTPDRQRAYMEGLAILAKVAMRGKELMSGAIGFRLDAIYEPPKWWRPGDSIFKTSRPDVDNLVKICMDSFNGIIWKDDAQVAETVIYKRYGENGPRLKIEIWPLIDEAKL